MKAEQLILKLHRDKIKIQLAGQQLKVFSPGGGIIPEEVLSEIRLHKTAIISLIQKATQEKRLYEPIMKLAQGEPYYAVSHAQKRLLLLIQHEDARLAYNSFTAKQLSGELQLEYFRQAFRCLIERHESLRTVFVSVAGEFMQSVMPAGDAGNVLGYTDLCGEPDAAGKIAMLVQDHYTYVFNLETGPLLKASLIRTAPREYVFLIVIHHIISDGWSLKVFLAELIHLYNAFLEQRMPALPSLHIQYKEYACWQNSLLQDETFISSHRDYWRERFQGEIQPLPLLPDYERPATRTFNGDKLKKTLPQEHSEGLELLCRKHHTSLFTALLAVWKTLLFRYTYSEDIIIGTPVAGRNHLELENQIGFYVNTLALRTNISRDDTFLSLLGKVNHTVIEALDHQLYPFDCLVDDIDLKRDSSRSPLFDITLVLQSTEDLDEIKGVKQGEVLKGLEISDYPFNYRYSIYDLSIRVTQQGRVLHMEIEFNTDLFSYSRIAQMYQHFLNLLDVVSKKPEVLLHKIDYLSEEEKRRLLARSHAQ